MRILLTSAALVALAAPASAAMITSLYSTGVTAGGVAAIGNGADLHWTLVGGTAYTGGVNGSFPIGPWVTDTATARWITPSNNASDGFVNGNYTFETTFTLGAFSSASFGGIFAADDSITDVRLNGVSLGISGGGYPFYSSFSYSGAAFQTGLNTLSFDVLNSGGGPIGLQVDLAGSYTSAEIPEPASWGLMISGLGLVGLAGRRRAGLAA